MNEAGALQIDEAGPADRAFICTLGAEVFGHLGPDYGAWHGGWLDNPAVGSYLGRIADAPVGYFMLGVLLGDGGARLIGDLIAIAVAGPWRRRGVGGRLLQSALQLVAELDSTARQRRVELNVAVDNTAARALFARAGFVELVGRGSVYPAGQQALRLGLELGVDPG